MKNNLLFGLLMLLTSTFACVQNHKSHRPDAKPNYQLVLKFDVPPSTDARMALDSAKKVLLKRLNAFYYSNLTVNEAGRTITLDLIGMDLKQSQPSDNFLQQMTSVLINEGRLDFYNTFRLGDKDLLQPFSSLLEENTWLASHLQLNSFPDAANLGFVSSKHLPAVDSILKKAIADGRLPSTASVAWSSQPDDLSSNAAYAFYFLKGEVVLTGKNITEVNATPTEYDPKEAAINITFDAEGTRIWEDMTTKAAQNGNREIAIVLNGRVLSSPRVINPITGGKSQVTGKFTESGAIALARILQGGQFPCSVKVENAQILR